ncbi:hypothetical protein B0H19DRAFT_1077367 [Mycena capillaripes]|nr:hypothetical protein B0H19DRAFT_1077367 [Mycena capillaripes]
MAPGAAGWQENMGNGGKVARWYWARQNSKGWRRMKRIRPEETVRPEVDDEDLVINVVVVKPLAFPLSIATAAPHRLISLALVSHRWGATRRRNWRNRREWRTYAGGVHVCFPASLLPVTPIERIRIRGCFFADIVDVACFYLHPSRVVGGVTFVRLCSRAGPVREALQDLDATGDTGFKSCTNSTRRKERSEAPATVEGGNEIAAGVAGDGERRRSGSASGEGGCMGWVWRLACLVSWAGTAAGCDTVFFAFLVLAKHIGTAAASSSRAFDLRASRTLLVEGGLMRAGGKTPIEKVPVRPFVDVVIALELRLGEGTYIEIVAVRVFSTFRKFELERTLARRQWTKKLLVVDVGLGDGGEGGTGSTGVAVHDRGKKGVLCIGTCSSHSQTSGPVSLLLMR